ncbi:MAG: hypothetical protein MK066_07100 [Crocinitomicaceae bacterium]|nr:hypothetical protein [Crocinitomicaceae bacterium]
MITNLFCFSQVAFEDFLEETDSQVKVEMGVELWDYYTRNNVDTLRLIGDELLINTSELDVLGEAVANGVMGSYYFRTGELRSCILFFSNAIKLFESLGNFDLLTDCYNEVGNCLYSQGYYNQASYFFQKSLLVGKEALDKTSSFSGLIGLGKTYCAVGDSSVGINLIWKYCTLSKLNHKWEALGNASAYLAQVCEENGEVELSRSLYSMSIESAKKSDSRTLLANGFNNQAIVWFESDDYDSSLFYFKKSLMVRMEIGKVKAVCESYFNLGNFFWGINSMDSSELYFRKAYRYGRKNQLQGDVVDALENLVDLYIELGYKGKMERASAELTLERKRLDARANLNHEVLLDTINFLKKKKEIVSNDSFIFEVVMCVLLILISAVFIYIDRPNLT